MLKRFLIGAALLVAMAGSAIAGSGCMPVTGIFTSVQEQQYINAALHAINSSNAGGSAPTTDCSNGPIIGQPWLNTSQTPWPLGIYDGTQYDWQGSLDPTNHIWIPVQGGGLATLTAATVTDLCQTTPQNYLTISGTTPITSFGASCGLGQWKFLAFSGAGQITYSSANILTPANQNIATANGDRAIAINLGAGLWNIFSYHSATMPIETTAAVQVPIGSVAIIFYTTPDPGYVLAVGQALSTTAYPALFAKIGYTYGGSGTTFYVPNLSGYYLAGADNMSGGGAGRITNFNADYIGAAGGVQSVVVQQANLQNFALPTSSSSSASFSLAVNLPYWGTGGASQFSFYTPYVSPPSNAPGSFGVSGWISVSTSTTVYSGGSGTPLPTLPPTKIVYFEMRAS